MKYCLLWQTQAHYAKWNKRKKNTYDLSYMWNFKYLVCIYVYECTYMCVCVCVCVCVLIDTKNKLMVTRGMGWWVEEMGGLFFVFWTFKFK